MAVLNKIEKWFTLYKGDDSVILFVFEDENGNDINLSSDYSEITFTMYDQSKTQELQYTIGSGLSIQNTNELKITLDDTTTGALDADQKYAYDIQFTLSSGDKETYIKGKFYVEDTFEGSSNDINSELVKIDDSGEQVVIELGSLGQKFSDYVGKSQDWAEGTDAEVTALGGEHSSKGWASESENFREQAAESAVSAQQEANNASYPANANLYDDEADFLASTSDGQFGIFEGSVWKNNSGVAQHQFDFITRVNSIQELLNIEGKGPNSRALVSGFYTQGDGGGGTFYWDAGEDKANHNGGTILDPDHSVTPGNSGWWTSENSGSGCFKRKEEKVTIEQYGGKSGAGNDVKDAFVAAIQGFNNGYFRKLIFPPKTWNLASGIDQTISDNLVIEAYGATFTSSYSPSSGSQFLRFEGENGSVLTTTLSSDAVKGEEELPLTSVSGIQEGDIVKLESDQSWIPSSAETTVEFNVIESVDAVNSKVYLDGPLYFNFQSAEDSSAGGDGNINVTVYRPTKGFRWSGGTFSFSDANNNVSIQLVYASGAEFNDLTFDNSANHGIQARESAYVTFNSCTFSNTGDLDPDATWGNGTFGYGVYSVNSCFVVANNCRSYRGWHGFECADGTRDMTLNNCASYGDAYGFNTHERNGMFRLNGCYLEGKQGLNFRGLNLRVFNTDIRTTAECIQFGDYNAESIIMKGSVFERLTAGDIATGAQTPGTLGIDGNYIEVSSCTFRGGGSTDDNKVFVRGSTTINRVSFSDCEFYNCTPDISAQDTIILKSVDLIDYAVSATRCVLGGSGVSSTDAHLKGCNFAGYESNASGTTRVLDGKDVTIYISDCDFMYDIGRLIRGTGTACNVYIRNIYSLSFAFKDTVTVKRFKDSEIVGVSEPLLQTGAIIENGAITNLMTDNGIYGENRGTSTQSGDGAKTTFTISHGLPDTPTQVEFWPASAGASSDAYISNITSSSFDIVFGTAPSSGTDNVVIRWFAKL